MDVAAVAVAAARMATRTNRGRLVSQRSSPTGAVVVLSSSSGIGGGVSADWIVRRTRRISQPLRARWQYERFPIPNASRFLCPVMGIHDVGEQGGSSLRTFMQAVEDLQASSA